MFFKILVFLHLINTSCISNISCEANFKDIGVRYLELSELKENIKFINDGSVRFMEKINNDGDLVITFEEAFNFFESKKIIKYKLVFRDNSLISYDFMIELDKGRESINSFNKIIKVLKNDSTNDFIQGNKYAYMLTNDKCQRFIRMHSIGYKKHVFGGASLSAP